MIKLSVVASLFISYNAQQQRPQESKYMKRIMMMIKKKKQVEDEKGKKKHLHTRIKHTSKKKGLIKFEFFNQRIPN